MALGAVQDVPLLSGAPARYVDAVNDAAALIMSVEAVRLLGALRHDRMAHMLSASLREWVYML